MEPTTSDRPRARRNADTSSVIRLAGDASRVLCLPLEGKVDRPDPPRGARRMRWSPPLLTGSVQGVTLTPHQSRRGRTRAATASPQGEAKTPHPSSGLRGTPDATFPSRGRLFFPSVRGRQGFTELLQDILTDTGEVFVHVFVGISQYMQPAFTQIRVAFSIRLHPCLFKML